MPNAVEVSGLRKSYGQVHAVRDVGFTVGYGEIGRASCRERVCLGV